MEKQQTSNEYGISQELLVLSQLVNYGTISIPYGNSARYDCILECNNKFYRIQIKALNMQDEDTILIPMSNQRLCSGGRVEKSYTSDEVDYMAISFNNNLYLFCPDLAKKTLTVRVNKPKQYNQHWIEDYHIEKVLEVKIKTWVDLKEETREQKGTSNQKKYNCIDCGTPVWNNNSRCVICSRYFQNNGLQKPTREELKELIKDTPFTVVGAKYGVTDNAIRKWCISYNLPSKVCDIKEIIKKGEWDLI